MNGDKTIRRILGLMLVTFLLAGCGGAAEPQPGATFVGTIAMDSAESAQITFDISDDGQAIVSLSLSFTNLACEGFSAGSSFSAVTTHIPITDGRFEYSSSDGEISGQFTSPTTAQGTAHFAFSGVAECGTWEWSATGQ